MVGRLSQWLLVLIIVIDVAFCDRSNWLCMPTATNASGVVPSTDLCVSPPVFSCVFRADVSEAFVANQAHQWNGTCFFDQVENRPCADWLRQRVPRYLCPVHPGASQVLDADQYCQHLACNSTEDCVRSYEQTMCPSFCTYCHAELGDSDSLVARRCADVASNDTAPATCYNGNERWLPLFDWFLFAASMAGAMLVLICVCVATCKAIRSAVASKPERY